MRIGQRIPYGVNRLLLERILHALGGIVIHGKGGEVQYYHRLVGKSPAINGRKKSSTIVGVKFVNRVIEVMTNTPMAA